MDSRILRILLICSVGGAVLGALIGLLLGIVAPSYYIGVFNLPSNTQRISQIGLGLGLSQGLIVGVIVGVVLAAIDAWKHGKSGGELQPPDAIPEAQFPRSIAKLRTWLFVIGSISIITALSIFGAMFESRLFDPAPAPECQWYQDKIHLNYIGQRALIVTHLAVPTVNHGAHLLSAAALKEPVVLMMKKDAPELDPRALKWLDPSGNPAEPPQVGDRIVALYYVPEHTVFRGTR